MEIPVLKVVAGLGVGAVTVGGGVLVAKNMKSSFDTPKSTIKDRLKRDGYSPLDIGKSDGWSEVLEAYNQKKNTPNLRFDHGNREVSDQEIKSTCEAVFKEDESNAKYEKAKKWCVVPNSVSQVLMSKSLTVLNVNATGDENQTEWSKLKEEYKDNSILGFLFRSDQDWKALRTKCKELTEKKPWDEDYENSIIYAERWCTNKSV